MSTIGGPGGIGGPKGPKGPDAAPDDVGDVSDVGRDQASTRPTRAAPTGDLDAIAADLAAGKLTRHEAIDKLVDQIAGSDELAPADRAELRELMSDLIANDPHLQGLVGRL